MIEADVAFEKILADCASPKDLEYYLMKHAFIVQHLVCRIAKDARQREGHIKSIYEEWAEMAVEQFKDPRVFNVETLH